MLGSLTMMMYGAHAALQHMLPQGSGKIINIGSVGGRIQQRGLVVYNACKAGVIGFTRNLAHEVALRGVNVLGVAPGIMIKPEMRQYLLDPQDDKQRAGRGAIHEAITQPGPTGARLVARGSRQHGRLPGFRGGRLHVRADHRRRRRAVDGLMPHALAATTFVERAARAVQLTR